MSDEDRVAVDATQRVWKPRLIELTHLPHPDLGDGVPTKVYVDPNHVYLIARSYVTLLRMDETKLEPQECTTVFSYGGTPMQVMESPEEVARRVNEAMQR